MRAHLGLERGTVVGKAAVMGLGHGLDEVSEAETVVQDPHIVTWGEWLGDEAGLVEECPELVAGTRVVVTGRSRLQSRGGAAEDHPQPRGEVVGEDAADGAVGAVRAVAQPSTATRCGAIARKAMPRCEIAFFASASSSPLVTSCPSAMKIGS